MRRLFPVMVLVLCFVSLGAAWQFADLLREHRALKAQLQGSEALLAQAKRQYEETQRKARIYARVKRFVRTAKELGLEKDKWHTYEVMVRKPLMFGEVREILEQCVSKDGYFFQPGSLSMVKDRKEQGKPNAQEIQEGDLFFEMKGNFLVRIK